MRGTHSLAKSRRKLIHGCVLTSGEACFWISVTAGGDPRRAVCGAAAVCGTARPLERRPWRNSITAPTGPEHGPAEAFPGLPGRNTTLLIAQPKPLDRLG